MTTIIENVRNNNRFERVSLESRGFPAPRVRRRANVRRGSTVCFTRGCWSLVYQTRRSIREKPPWTIGSNTVRLVRKSFASIGVNDDNKTHSYCNIQVSYWLSHGTIIGAKMIVSLRATCGRISTNRRRSNRSDNTKYSRIFRSYQCSKICRACVRSRGDTTGTLSRNRLHAVLWIIPRAGLSSGNWKRQQQEQ